MIRKILLGFLAGSLMSLQATAADSTLISNARIIDGTGAESFTGDVLIRDGIIASIHAPGEGPQEGNTVIDAAGRVLAPGFIDLHTHGDPLERSFDNFLAMGVTTVTASIPTTHLVFQSSGLKCSF